MEWWRGAVIYQIYPRSFLDSNGDGIGDLPGIAERLPYVASLGVDAIWISPFFTSPMEDFGYDISDYRGVDPIFGTLTDFDRLLAQAHELGLKVMIDMVLSHTSHRHPWFLESRRSRDNPKSDWYVWADAKRDGSAPNNWLSMFGGPAWQWEPRREQYYLHNFLPGQPDLNVHNKAVQNALLEECRFWLERGVDGFRLDACNFLTHDRKLRNNPPRPAGAPPTDGVRPSNPYNRQMHVFDKSRPETLPFLRRLRALAREFGEVALLAEIADDNSLKVMEEYAGPGAPLHSAYCFALLGPQLDTHYLPDAFQAFHNGRHHGWPSWAFSNHDVARAVTRWGGEAAPADYAKILIALLGSLRGTVFLYQGEELALPEATVPLEHLRDPFGLNFYPEFRGRDGCRTPMPWDAELPQAGFSTGEPWLPVAPEHLPLAVSLQETDPKSVLNFTRGFLRWRRGHPTLITGDIAFIATEPGLVAFERRSEQERLLVVCALTGDGFRLRLPAPVEREFSLPGLPAGRLDGDELDMPQYGFYVARLAAAEEAGDGALPAERLAGG